MRHIAKVDANQPAIVRLLRMHGCHVLHLHELGKGAPDLSVTLNGQHAYVELKDGSKSPSHRRLTPDEERWRLECQGNARYVIVESEEDAIALVDSMRNPD